MKRRALVGVVIATTLLAACGSDSGSGGGTTAPPVTTAASTTAASTTTTGAGTGEVTTPSSPGAETTGTAPAAPPSGVLRVGSFADPISFDPTVAQPQTYLYMNAVYDTLLRRDAKGELLPGLATEWSQPDLDTWEFELRQGVTFTDGAPFDAAAVKANLDRDRTKPGNPSASNFVGITDVVVVDPATVRVEFDEPNPAFADGMATYASAMVSPNALDTDLTRAPVGTGGWIYDKADSQDTVKHVFTLNPNYWDKASQGVERIEVLVLADNNARLNALKSGQVDMIDTVTSGQVDQVGSDAEVVTINDQVNMLVIGDRNGELVPAFAKTEVRQAIAYAIDREAFNDAVFGGKGGAEGGFFATSSKWYDPATKDAYPYDPDKARDLLKQAGFPDGFSFKLATFSTIKTQAEAIAQLLGDVGIKVELTDIQPGTSLAEYRKKNFAAIFVPTSFSHPHEMWARLVGATGALNPWGITSPDIDAIALAAAPLTGAEQQAKYAELQEAILDAGVAPVLAQSSVNAAVRPNVTSSLGELFIYSGERGIRPQGLRVG